MANRVFEIQWFCHCIPQPAQSSASLIVASILHYVYEIKRNAQLFICPKNYKIKRNAVYHLHAIRQHMICHVSLRAS